MSDAVKNRIIAIIAEQAVLEPAQVTETSTLEDMGIDSLGLVEMIFAIEEAFDVSVPFNANEPNGPSFDLSSVAAVVRAVEALIAARGR